MTMFRREDRVRWSRDQKIHILSSVAPKKGTVLVLDGLEIPDDELTMLCSKCTRDATCFGRETGSAYCVECALPIDDVLEVRITSDTLCPCACGEDLAAAPAREPWTMGAIVCEYRDCIHCGSTRAFMHVNENGREVAIYADPATSEVTHAASAILDCIDVDPPSERAVMMRNGIVVARTVVAVDGELYWHILAPKR